MTRIFRVIWRLKVTERMASEVNLAAAVAGSSRQAWIREAIEAELARQKKSRR